MRSVFFKVDLLMIMCHFFFIFEELINALYKWNIREKDIYSLQIGHLLHMTSLIEI